MFAVESLILYNKGCKVFHPRFGAGIVEKIGMDDPGTQLCYHIRYIWDKSLSFTPMDNVVRIGLRKVITPEECLRVLEEMTRFPSPLDVPWRLQKEFLHAEICRGDPFTNASLWNRLNSKNKKDRSVVEISYLNLLTKLLFSELALARDMEISEVEKEVQELYERNRGAQYFHRF
ncbi:MAG: CarD family transcriptional regulator [bacterium]